MWRGKIKEQIQARQLRKHGKSVKEIARHLGVAKSSVSVWVRSVRLTATQRKNLQLRELRGGAKGQRTMKRNWEEYHKLYPKPAPKGPRWPKRDVEKFFDTWTPEMAYVLGYFTADGCMYKNKRGSCYTSFTSTDRELIETVKRLMGVKNAIEEYQRPKPNCKRRFVLQIGSKTLYATLIELGFTPNKSLSVSLPSIPKSVFCHFLRGYFDGDGSIGIVITRGKGKKRLASRVVVRFTSGSYDLLSSLQKELTLLGIVRGGSIYVAGPSDFKLTYSTGDARQLYKFMYPSNVPCLERKEQVFERAFKFLGPVV